jgi:hypothetical protein
VITPLSRDSLEISLLQTIIRNYTPLSTESLETNLLVITPLSRDSLEIKFIGDNH